MAPFKIEQPRSEVDYISDEHQINDEDIQYRDSKETSSFGSMIRSLTNEIGEAFDQQSQPASKAQKRPPLAVMTSLHDEERQDVEDDGDSLKKNRNKGQVIDTRETISNHVQLGSPGSSFDRFSKKKALTTDSIERTLPTTTLSSDSPAFTFERDSLNHSKNASSPQSREASFSKLMDGWKAMEGPSGSNEAFADVKQVRFRPIRENDEKLSPPPLETRITSESSEMDQIYAPMYEVSLVESGSSSVSLLSYDDTIEVEEAPMHEGNVNSAKLDEAIEGAGPQEGAVDEYFNEKETEKNMPDTEETSYQKEDDDDKNIQPSIKPSKSEGTKDSALDALTRLLTKETSEPIETTDAQSPTSPILKTLPSASSQSDQSLHNTNPSKCDSTISGIKKEDCENLRKKDDEVSADRDKIIAITGIISPMTEDHGGSDEDVHPKIDSSQEQGHTEHKFSQADQVVIDINKETPNIEGSAVKDPFTFTLDLFPSKVASSYKEKQQQNNNTEVENTVEWKIDSNRNQEQNHQQDHPLSSSPKTKQIELSSLTKSHKKNNKSSVSFDEELRLVQEKMKAKMEGDIVLSTSGKAEKVEDCVDRVKEEKITTTALDKSSLLSGSLEETNLLTDSVDQFQEVGKQKQTIRGIDSSTLLTDSFDQAQSGSGVDNSLRAEREKEEYLNAQPPPLKEIFIPETPQYGYGWYVKPVWEIKNEHAVKNNRIQELKRKLKNLRKRRRLREI